MAFNAGQVLLMFPLCIDLMSIPELTLSPANIGESTGR